MFAISVHATDKVDPIAPVLCTVEAYPRRVVAVTVADTVPGIVSKARVNRAVMIAIEVAWVA